MKTRKSNLLAIVLLIAQFTVIGEEIAVRATPLARQFTGWSVYLAMLTMAALVILLVGSPFLWRSHRWLAISGLCIVCFMISGVFVPISSW